MYEFEAITFEIYIGGAWMDVTADVLQDPRPHWNRGIMSLGLMEHVAHPGILTFALNNSASNSQATLGYYSPVATEETTHFWRTGRWYMHNPVRLSFTFEGITWYKYHGYITEVGIEPGQYEGRRVFVTCKDYMHYLNTQLIVLPSVQTTVYGSAAIETLIDGMDLQPAATDYNTPWAGYYLATVFDRVNGNTTATAEIRKIAISDAAYFIIYGGTTTGETLYYGNPSAGRVTSRPLANEEVDNVLMETGDNLLLETSDKILLNASTTAAITDEVMSGANIQTGVNFSNYVRCVLYPREVDTAATTVLFTLRDTPEMEGGSTLAFSGVYRDPNNEGEHVCGTEMVTPVITTDYTANSSASGGGTDMSTSLSVTATYGAEGVQYSLVNSSTGTFYVTKLQARGKGIYTYDRIEIISDDANEAGIETGTIGMFNPTVVDLPYFMTKLEYSIAMFGQYHGKSQYPNSLGVTRLPVSANKSANNMYIFLRICEPLNALNFSETVSSWAGLATYDGKIRGYEAEIIDGKHVTFYLTMLSNYF